MNRTDIEKVIIELEWDMFQKVQNIGGRADCQDQRKTFAVMRMSQFESWDLDVVCSYLKDLQDARSQGRNLVMEKYAYMMEETDPAYFEQIKSLLPPISDTVRLLVEKIIVHYMLWVEEFAIQYPNIRKNGRPAEAASIDGTTSLKNYLKCELYTYSQRTLELFIQSIVQYPELNRYWVSMEKMVHAHGYKNLEEAEADLGGVVRLN